MTDLLLIIAKIIAFAAGLALTGWTILSALRSFVLARSDNAFLTRVVFIWVGRLLRLRMYYIDDFYRRDRILAYFAPLTLISLPLIWLMLIMIGYTAMFWAISSELNLRQALVMSGSSLMTLGFSFTDELPVIILAFTEAALGMMFIALLIGYLPTMYSAFSARESQITRLEVRAGTPPSSLEMIRRLDFAGILYNEDRLWDLWETWEDCFAQLEESHTVLAPLNFFRSPHPDRHWISAAGTVMDTAALIASSVKIDVPLRAGLVIRSGFVALRAIADFFAIPYDPDPQPDDPISITRAEFDEAYDFLASIGIPLNEDRNQCWQDFAGWRVNYDDVLCRLASLLNVPHAHWVTDRPLDPFAPLNKKA